MKDKIEKIKQLLSEAEAIQFTMQTCGVKRNGLVAYDLVKQDTVLTERIVTLNKVLKILKEDQN